VRCHCHRPQQTLARPAEVCGVGYLSGAAVRVRFLPAPPDAGIVFVRTDLSPAVRIPATADRVSGTQRRTTLGRPPAQVGLVEHVLAALAGLHIDNCTVELNAPEPPGLDGSALGFVRALLRAGPRRQTAPRAVICPQRSVVVTDGSATVALHPAEGPGLTMSYFLDYGPGAPIARQVHTQPLTPGLFVQHLAACRTFILESEVAALRRQGIGLTTTVADLLVFGAHGPIGNRLRFANEPARHKVLDLVGDLALAGADLCGHVVAYRSGHPLNVELARRLRQELAAPQPCRPAA
jgi:UDP-3-O-acyl N-acetylglucosamine deacetylase